MKKQIKREDLKTNFLKQSIIRLDYDRLFEKDTEKFIELIYPYLISKEYKMNSNTLSNVNLNINIDDFNNMTNDINTNAEKYTSFINKEGNIIVEITKEYIVMNIFYNKFENFEEFSEIFEEMSEKLKNIRIGFSFNRIGIRKINVLALKDISNINCYLEEPTFNFTKLINGEKATNFIVKDSIESFIINDYKINKKVNVTKGNMIVENKEEQELYQIILDIDVYNDDMKENNIKLSKMNDELFEIYKDSLKSDFLNKMKIQNYENEEIVRI